MATTSNNPVSEAKPEINVGRLYAFLSCTLRLYLYTNSTQFSEHAADNVRDKMEAQWAHLSEDERRIATKVSATLDVPTNA